MILEFANFPHKPVDDFQIDDYVKVKKGEYSGRIGTIATISTGGLFSTISFGVRFLDNGEYLFAIFKSYEIQKLTPEEKDFLIDTGKYNL